MSRRLVFLAKTLAAGSFIWGIPGLLYAASVEGGPLGGVARGQDVFVLLAAAVNLHHFVLDGAIWKLRDGRVARILIRSEAVEPTPIDPGRSRAWLALTIYVIGTLATLQVLGSWALREVAFHPALRRADMVASARSLARLERIRADSSSDHLKLGKFAQHRGNARLAAHHYDRSLAKQPTVAAWRAIGELAQRSGKLEEAIAAYEKALELHPDHPQVLYDLGSVWLVLGEPERAIPHLERGVELMPENSTLLSALAKARQGIEGQP